MTCGINTERHWQNLNSKANFLPVGYSSTTRLIVWNPNCTLSVYFTLSCFMYIVNIHVQTTTTYFNKLLRCKVEIYTCDYDYLGDIWALGSGSSDDTGISWYMDDGLSDSFLCVENSLRKVLSSAALSSCILIEDLGRFLQSYQWDYNYIIWWYKWGMLPLELSSHL